MPRAGFRAALSSLGNREYRWLFVSNLLFFFAMQGQWLVRSWLAYELTQSELALGLVSFAVALPMTAIAPFGGVIADRIERRNLIAGGQLLLIASELTVLVLLATGMLRFWHLLVLASVMGCVFPFIMPARQALVVNVVGKRELTNAMALSMGGMNAARVAAPALAGVMISVIGMTRTYAYSVALYVAALVCLLQVSRSPAMARTGRQGMIGDIGEGVRYMVDHRLILVLLLFGLLPMFLAMPFQTLLPVFAKDIWHVGSEGFGVLNAAGGIGGLIGSIFVASRAESEKRLRNMMVSVLLFCGFLTVFAQSPWFWVALPLMLVANVFSSVFGTLNNTAVQVLIPDHVRGRISGFLMMSFGLPMLGTLPMSAVAEGFGAPTAVALAALLAAGTALLFYAGSAGLRNLDRSVADALAESAADQRAEAEARPSAVRLGEAALSRRAGADV
jgi:MFS family permease